MVRSMVPGADFGKSQAALKVPGAGAGQSQPAPKVPGAGAGLWCRVPVVSKFQIDFSLESFNLKVSSELHFI